MKTLFIWLALIITAQAMDNGQWENIPPNIRNWFKHVVSPKGVPCCDMADGHRTTWRGTAVGYEVPIGDEWIPVPAEAVVNNAGNPFDEAVVWYVDQANDKTAPHPAQRYFIRCFVVGSQG